METRDHLRELDEAIASFFATKTNEEILAFVKEANYDIYKDVEFPVLNACEGFAGDVWSLRQAPAASVARPGTAAQEELVTVQEVAWEWADNYAYELAA